MNIKQLARRSVLAASGLALVACQDAPTTPSIREVPVLAKSKPQSAPTVVPLSPSALRVDALRDALDRVQTALVSDDRAKAIAVGLRQAISALERGDSQSVARALKGVEQTLESYTAADAAMAPDLDVLRLALRTAASS